MKKRNITENSITHREPNGRVQLKILKIEWYQSVEASKRMNEQKKHQKKQHIVYNHWRVLKENQSSTRQRRGYKHLHIHIQVTHRHTHAYTV